VTLLHSLQLRAVAAGAIAILLLPACTPSPRPLPDHLPASEGRVVERLDAPPDGFVRLGTVSDGERIVRAGGASPNLSGPHPICGCPDPIT
jgi:hypothetical protein